MDANIIDVQPLVDIEIDDRFLLAYVPEDEGLNSEDRFSLAWQRMDLEADDLECQLADANLL